MKRNSIKIGTLCVMMMVASGCSENFLQVDPQGQQPGEQFWKNADDANKAVNAMYANLHDWKNIGFAAMAIESVASDEAEKGSSASDAAYFNNFDTFNAASTEGQISEFWNGCYQTINLANQVLTNVPAIAMDDALKSRYYAEAKFIRAYTYFRLNRAYGGVPLRLTVPKDASEYNIPRSTKDEVWAAIEKDLVEAAAVLPQKYGNADLGRITKGAALSLHAKVAMYQKKWPMVKSLTDQVMGLGYTLFPDFEAQFRVENENNSESIFEIQAQRILGNENASNSQYSQFQGVRGVPAGGWGFNVPTQVLADAFETGDARRDGTILFRGETTPAGDIIPAAGDNPRYNQKSYVPFSKHIAGTRQGSDQNIRAIRYADVLLMNAEANVELGNAAAALTPLNAVRARARDGKTGVLPNISTTDQAALRTAVYKERQYELAMEFDRFFDVIRQGRGQEVFGVKGFKTGKNEHWPIPQNEIDLSGGVLTQNP